MSDAVQVDRKDYPRLLELWGAGVSAVDCGEELGLTGDRNAVREAVLRAVEDAARAALTKAPVVMKAKPAKQTKRAKAPVVEEDEDDGFDSDGIVDTTSADDLLIPIERRRSMLGPPYSQYPEVQPGECRWPIGDIKKDADAFFFCGDTISTRNDNSSCYCGTHWLRSHQSR